MFQTVPLTYSQLLTILIILIVCTFLLVFFLVKKGIILRRKDTTFLFGGDTNDPKEKAYNLIIFLDALNTKDDINQIDAIILSRQKKYCKEKLQMLSEKLLSSFRNLMLESLGIELSQVLTNRDYLYFSLVADKINSVGIKHIMDDFEENGLSTKKHPTFYARERSNSCLSHIECYLQSLLIGIETIDKTVFDGMWEELKEIYLGALIDIYTYAIEFAVKGKEKKKELQNQLYEKVKRIDGISEDQFQKMFSPASGEDFLNL